MTSFMSFLSFRFAFSASFPLFRFGKHRWLRGQFLIHFRFVHVPEDITVALNKRTDLIALQSLFALAYQCETLDEFAKALK